MEQEFFVQDELQELSSKGDPTSVATNQAQKKVTFKSYSTHDNYLFPASTNDYISQTHIARFISAVIDHIGIGFLIDKYKGGGSSAYHPAMMLKVWILGCIYRIYSCRKLAQVLSENLAFIWISGNQCPDFRTLNNFRLLLEEEIKEIFRKVLRLCIDLGLVDSEEVFIDHTKIEANANRHKMTWRKTVEKQLEKYETEIDQLFQYINELNLREDQESVARAETKEWNEEEVNEAISQINEEIKEKQREKDEGGEIKKKLRRAKEVLNKREEYEGKLEILGDRNSYSNTDHEAPGMMQKDKVSIKPSYNEGIVASDGFVFNYELSEKSSDNSNFVEIIEGVKENTGSLPGLVHSDGAYGNEENMSYLEEDGIGNYLKYNTYRREKSRKWYREGVRKESFLYEKEYDRYRCPHGAYLDFTEERERTTNSGYIKKSDFIKLMKKLVQAVHLKKHVLKEPVGG